MQSVEITSSLLETISFGEPAHSFLARYAKKRGYKNVFLLVSQTLETQTGEIENFRRSLGTLYAGAWSGMRAHSPREDVLSAAKSAKESGVDLLVTVGGGSLTDGAKAVCMCLALKIRTADEMEKYRAPRKLEQALKARMGSLLPLVNVPTTLSGGEFSGIAGVTDTRLSPPVKQGFSSRYLQPKVVIMDPKLSQHTPEWLFLSTGMRSIDHCVEAICSIKSQPYSTAIAAAALKVLAKALLEVKENPNDCLDARSRCQIGVALISPAIQQVPFGASHGIGHVLGGTANVPHGYTSCINLPHVLEFNSKDPSTNDKMKLVSECFGRPSVHAAIVMDDYIRRLGLPRSLEQVGVKVSMHETIAKLSMQDFMLKTNPRAITSYTDIMDILKDAQTGVVGRTLVPKHCRL